MIFVLAIIASVLCYRVCTKRYNHELHAAVHKEFLQLFPDAKLNIERVSQDKSGNLVVTNFSLASELESQRGLPPTFQAERCVLSGKLGLEDWFNEEISVAKVELFGVQ
ncbi:MAG: hypothetical protein AAF483_12265, partial [Planctomycetota bacterium]